MKFVTEPKKSYGDPSSVKVGTTFLRGTTPIHFVIMLG